jgi:RimJ/RimL family protein N-acetyltransferase
VERQGGRGRVVLETPRLVLRELTEDDLEFVAGMLGHSEVMRHYPKPLSREESALWIARQRARYAADGHGLWLAEEKARGAPVGQVGLLTQIVERASESEIGYLLHRPFWHRGFATEAAAGVRDHAWAVRGLTRLVSLIRPANLPSQAVARRVGMSPEREVEFHGLPHLLFSTTRFVRGAAPPSV